MGNERESLELFLDSLDHVLTYVIFERPAYIYNELSESSRHAWYALKEQNIVRLAKALEKEAKDLLKGVK